MGFGEGVRLWVCMAMDVWERNIHVQSGGRGEEEGGEDEEWGCELHVFSEDVLAGLWNILTELVSVDK